MLILEVIHQPMRAPDLQIIHLEPDCKVLLEDPTEANRTSSAPSEWTENSAVNGAGQQACNTPKRTYKPTGSPPTTIQAGSIGSIVDRDELAGGRSRLLPSDVDLFADENSEPIDNDQTSTGEKLCPADDARTSTIAAPEKPSGLTIWLTMPKKTSPYHLRARSEHERNSWATALERAKQHLYRTCIHCWANVDAASSGATGTTFYSIPLLRHDADDEPLQSLLKSLNLIICCHNSPSGGLAALEWRTSKSLGQAIHGSNPQSACSSTDWRC
eukprot:SAG31_NODE_641_length_13313_cov_5.365219_6_plen_272_part_00